MLFAFNFFSASGTAPLGILVVVGAPNTFFLNVESIFASVGLPLKPGALYIALC